VSALLQEIQLTIPKISDELKTKIVSKSDALDFLGREIVPSGSENKFIARISTKQIAKIKSRLADEYSLEKSVEENKSFQETIIELSRSVAAYLGIYRDASNFAAFEGDLRGQSRTIVARLFEKLFGPEAIDSLTPEGRRFLGINTLEQIPFDFTHSLRG
jgi:hypothetical protein